MRYRRRVQRNAITITTVPVRELNTTRARIFFRLHLHIIQLRHKRHPRAGTGRRTHGNVGGTLRGGNAAKRGVDRRRNVVGVFKRWALQG